MERKAESMEQILEQVPPELRPLLEHMTQGMEETEAAGTVVLTLTRSGTSIIAMAHPYLAGPGRPMVEDFLERVVDITRAAANALAPLCLAQLQLDEDGGDEEANGDGGGPAN